MAVPMHDLRANDPTSVHRRACRQTAVRVLRIEEGRRARRGRHHGRCRARPDRAVCLQRLTVAVPLPVLRRRGCTEVRECSRRARRMQVLCTERGGVPRDSARPVPCSGPRANRGMDERSDPVAVSVSAMRGRSQPKLRKRPRRQRLPTVWSREDRCSPTAGSGCCRGDHAQPPARTPHRLSGL